MSRGRPWRVTESRRWGRAALDRLRRGDIGGLEPLVDRYHTRAARAAYLVVRDAALTENVAQDAFVRAFEKAGSFDAGGPFGPWGPLGSGAAGSDKVFEGTLGPSG